MPFGRNQRSYAIRRGVRCAGVPRSPAAADHGKELSECLAERPPVSHGSWGAAGGRSRTRRRRCRAEPRPACSMRQGSSRRRALLETKNPGRSRGQSTSVVLLLAALPLSALTTLLAAAPSGLLLLLAWLRLAAAALLLARFVLAALLLAGILLVRIVHNFSYFDSSL